MYTQMYTDHVVYFVHKNINFICFFEFYILKDTCYLTFGFIELDKFCIVSWFQDYVSISAGFVTFTSSVAVGIFVRILAVLFGTTETFLIRLFIFFVASVASPLYWIRSNEAMKQFAVDFLQFKMSMKK